MKKQGYTREQKIQYYSTELAWAAANGKQGYAKYCLGRLNYIRSEKYQDWSTDLQIPDKAASLK